MARFISSYILGFFFKWFCIVSVSFVSFFCREKPLSLFTLLLISLPLSSILELIGIHLSMATGYSFLCIICFLSFLMTSRLSNCFFTSELIMLDVLPPDRPNCLPSHLLDA